MTSEMLQPPRCRSCSAVLTPPGHVCGVCQTPQQVTQAPQVLPPTQQKSAAVAVLLSFLWLGAGHLYLGRIPAGILLAIYGAILALMMFSLIGFIIAFPIWAVSVVIVMVMAAAATGSVNREAQA